MLQHDLNCQEGHLISTFHPATRFLCSSGNMVMILYSLQCLRVQVARCVHCGSSAATTETLNKEKSSSSRVSAKPVCGHSHFSCATGKAGGIWAKWRIGGFLCVREPYAIQPALKYIPKDGKWQYKLGCLSPLQKFTPNRCPNRYLISAGTGGSVLTRCFRMVFLLHECLLTRHKQAQSMHLANIILNWN